MRKKFTRPLFLIAFLIVIFSLVGAFYMYYITYIKETPEIKLSGKLSINYLNGYILNIHNNKEIGITIVNDSNEDIYYYIEFKNVKNVDNNVSYEIIGDDDYDKTDILNNYNSIVDSYILIEKGSVHNYKIKFSSTKELMYSLEINIENENLRTLSFADLILANNTVKQSSTTSVGSDIAITDEGLIESIDDDGKTYYFRGSVLNNYVLINDLLFRIVRINGNGTVRLILNEGLSSLSSYYNKEYDFNNSLVQKTLNEWFDTNFSDVSSYFANETFCNDLAKENDTFVAYNRIVKDNSPSFICIGDKTLSKVGLLTADEALYAGATKKDNNTKYYLYNSKIGADWFFMTSAIYKNNTYYPFSMSSNGKVIYTDSGKNLRIIRPVVNINKVVIASGDGTLDNPYVFTFEK